MSIWSTAISTIIPLEPAPSPSIILAIVYFSSLARPEASVALFDDSTQDERTGRCSKNARNKDGRGWKWKVSSAGVGLATAANEQRTTRQRGVALLWIHDVQPPFPPAKKPLKSVSLCRPADNNVPPLAPRYFFPPTSPSTQHPLLSPRKYCAQPRHDICWDFLIIGPERIDFEDWFVVLENPFYHIFFFFFLLRISVKILPRSSVVSVSKIDPPYWNILFTFYFVYLCKNAPRSFVTVFRETPTRELLVIEVGCQMHRSRRNICYRSTRKFFQFP